MSDKTLKEALETYQQRVSILKKGYAQEKYRIAQIGRSFLADKVVRYITSVDISTYRDQRLDGINLRTKKKLSPSTVRLELALLSNFFEIARIEWGLCDGNPVNNVRKPKNPPGRDRRLLPREERRILSYCKEHRNPELYSIIVIALETAMRQGEILQLRWDYVNLKTRIAHLPETKNGTKRDVPLSIRAREAFIRLGVKSSGLVFHYSSNGLKSSWRFILKQLGIENLHFHDLRHEAVSRLFEIGTLDMMEVAAISGHKSLSMLKRYTHLKAQRLVKKLDGNRNKSRQYVIDHMIPYPAIVESKTSGINLRILDFPGIVSSGPNLEVALQNAQNVLLRQLMILLREGSTIPQPNQYLDNIDELKIIMIDPLASFEDGY